MFFFFFLNHELMIDHSDFLIATWLESWNKKGNRFENRSAGNIFFLSYAYYCAILSLMNHGYGYSLPIHQRPVL